MKVRVQDPIGFGNDVARCRWLFYFAAFLTTRFCHQGMICDATCYRTHDRVFASSRDEIGTNNKGKWRAFLCKAHDWARV